MYNNIKILREQTETARAGLKWVATSNTKLDISL
jgi:hypothetical protein